MRPLVSLLFLSAISLAAQDTAAIPPLRNFSIPQRIGVLTEAQVSLEQALSMALANNNDIDSSRMDREIAYFNFVSAKGVFDPLVGALSQFQKQVTPVATALGGSST